MPAESEPSSPPSASGSADGHPGRERAADALVGWVSRGFEAEHPHREAHREWVDERLVRRLVGIARPLLLGQLFFIGLVGVICAGSLSATALTAWMSALVAGATVRAGLPHWLDRRQADARARRRAVRWSTLAMGAIWGGGLVLLAPGMEIERLFLVLVLIAAMLAVSATTLAPDIRAFHHFALPLVAGLVAAILRHGSTDVHWLAAGVTIAFTVWATIHVRQLNGRLHVELGTAFDHRRHEERAARERAVLSALLHSLPDAVVVLQVDGRVLGVNRGFERMFGWTPEETLGADVFDLVVPEDTRDQSRSRLVELLRNGGRVRDVERLRKDGTPVSVRLVGGAVEGIPDVVVALYSDISRLKETEVALENAREVAEEASLAKSEFLATMSHEIRTPMNAIIGMAELLAETELTATQAGYVEVFRAAGDTLLTLINQILDLSKIEAGHLELDERHFDLWELLERTIQIFAIPTHQKGVEIASHIEPDVPQWVVGDPDRLRQVLVNLIGNAVKFTDEGEVVLHAELADADDPTRIRLEVRDTGPGIPKDRLQAIFDRFTQADSSTTRRHGGTGLGLTISAALTELMNGTIGVESAPGEGSTFHFTVRLPPGEPIEPESGAESFQDMEGLHILVVDDNATNRLVLSEVLLGWGARPREVSGGREALEELQMARDAGKPYDLVLLDGHMPGLDGFEVAEEIQNDPGLTGMTMMMLTSSGGQAGDIQRARDAGISTYLVKPVRRAELLENIRAARSGTLAENRIESLPPDATRAADPTARILLVEDTEDNRMLVQAYLNRSGYHLQTAERGEVAVRMYTESPGSFDLILMDIRMPGMDGYEATRQIRAWEEEHELDPVPVVALTAHALEEERRKSLEAGCDQHLTKPIRKAPLLAAIARYARVTR